MKNLRIPYVLTNNNLILIILCLVILFPNVAKDTQIESNPQNFLSEKTISPRLTTITNRVPIEDTILPMTNLTVSQYIYGQGQVNTFRTSVLSLNSTHWITHLEYANTTAIPSTFESAISRESVNHYYPYSVDFVWDQLQDERFDFWIDPTDFTLDYVFPVYYGAIYDASVVGLENITMNGVGTFEAWNVTVDIPNTPNFALYEKNTGIALSVYIKIVSDIWYNITDAELTILPGDYIGPTLDDLSPSNSSILASGSLVTASFTSPYGVQNLKYNWDNETDITITSADFQTSLPPMDGFHNLTIIVTDNIGYSSSYFLIYRTDNSLPGVILNDPQNNSRIQGSKELNFTIVSGNGTFTYNWNYSAVNVSFSMSGENTIIYVPSPQLETTRILKVYIKSNLTEDWITSTYQFIVDNTPPEIIVFDFENNSVLKGEVIIPFSPSEDVNVLYSINNGSESSFFVEASENSTLKFRNLENGTYELELTLEDEAGNFINIFLRFSIYSSSFNWNWHLEAEQTQTYDFRDEFGVLWFSFVIVSKTDQSFNLSLLSPSDSPSLSTDSEFGINFLCELPDDILYVSFTYLLPEPLVNSNQEFQVKKWVVWNKQSQKWSEVETIYNQILHAWVTTSLGYNQYFALVETGESTQLKSVEVGGGSIPSFELPFVIMSLLAIYGNKSSRKQK
ncbi:MAG: hypothetical protein ACW98F_19390 [Candidatus Hodarchaeales archaeon]